MAAFAPAPLTAHYSFEGIGGFGLGFGAAGFVGTAMNEVNPHRQKVLNRAFPDTPLEGDIRHVRGCEIGKPDVMVAGFPCKGLSIGKGHRKGLEDVDSHLFYEWLRILDEHLALVEYARPRVVVLENAPGILNLPLAMAAVTMGLEELGYGWAYRVVNGSVLRDPFGRSTPQQRRRWFLVGHLGGDPRPAWAVLGDPGPGGGPTAPGAGGLAEAGLDTRPFAPEGSGITDVWRKSANSQKSITFGYAGGYRENWKADGKANVLAASDGGLANRQKHLIYQRGRLRTTTPLEWERLNGFPDDWTAGMPESQRFAALGDSAHTGSTYWVALRVRALFETLAAHPTLFAA